MHPAIDIAKADLIEGMAKGMAVLESFDTERQRLNATLTAQRTGLSRAAARRYLLTLAHLGYLETDGNFFWLTSKVLRFSGSYLASSRLPRAVQALLNQIAALADASFSVAVLDRDEVVIVARSPPPARPTSVQNNTPKALSGRTWMAHGLHLGARLPACATSTGRILLSALDDKEFSLWVQTHRLARLTPYTVTDVATFKKIVKQVRKKDFCIAHQEHEVGVSAVAVPLRNSHGQTIAALNGVMDSEHMRRDGKMDELLALLVWAANEVRVAL